MERYNSVFSKEEEIQEDTQEVKESNYGWEIKRGKEWNALEDAIEMFGEKSLLDQLAQAMGTKELGENLAYIFRMNDYQSPYLK